MTQTMARAIPEALAEAPKGELVQMVMRARSLAKSYKLKEHAAHTGKTLLCTLTGAVGGATAGVMAAFPKVAHLPRTRVRTDLIVGGIIAGLGAFDVFDSASRYIAEYGNGLIDFGVGDVVRNTIMAKRSAAPVASAAGQRPRAA